MIHVPAAVVLSIKNAAANKDKTRGGNKWLKPFCYRPFCGVLSLFYFVAPALSMGAGLYKFFN